MNKLLFAVIVFAALALLLLFAGTTLESRPLVGAGVLCMAVGAFLVGLREITGRWAQDYGTPRNTAVFTGAAAVLIGVETLAASTAVAVGGVAYWMGREETLLAFVVDRPGFALLAAGLVLVGGGGARVLGAQDWKGSFFLHLPDRIGAVILSVVGLAILSVGAFEIAAPQAFDSILDGFLAPLRQPPGR